MTNSSKMNSGSLAAATSISNNSSVKPCRSRVLTGIPSNISKRSFHISGHNGDLILQSICLSHGWIILDDVNSDQFYFKWTELRKFIDYTKFREGNNGVLITMVTKLCVLGQQIVNHYPNMSLLTTKIGLLESLREYYRVSSRVFTHRK